MEKIQKYQIGDLVEVRPHKGRFTSYMRGIILSVRPPIGILSTYRYMIKGFRYDGYDRYSDIKYLSTQMIRPYDAVQFIQNYATWCHCCSGGKLKFHDDIENIDNMDTFYPVCDKCGHTPFYSVRIHMYPSDFD